jgi:hypothetical protein
VDKQYLFELREQAIEKFTQLVRDKSSDFFNGEYSIYGFAGETLDKFRCNLDTISDTLSNIGNRSLIIVFTIVIDNDSDEEHIQKGHTLINLTNSKDEVVLRFIVQTLVKD